MIMVMMMMIMMMMMMMMIQCKSIGTNMAYNEKVHCNHGYHELPYVV